MIELIIPIYKYLQEFKFGLNDFPLTIKKLKYTFAMKIIIWYEII